MDKIIVLMGRTGSGKNYLLDKFIEANPSFKKVITYTDRPARKGEKDGVDYWFLTKEEMKEMIKNNDLLEYAQYNVLNDKNKNDIFTYGTHKNSFQNDSSGLVCILDYKGYKKVKNIYQDRVMGFEIKLDKNIRKQNYLDRGGNINEFLRREEEDNKKFKECSRDIDVWHLENKIGKADDTIKVMNVFIDFYSKL